MPLDAPAPPRRAPAPKSHAELVADAAHIEALILAFERARILAEAYRDAMDDGDPLRRSVQGAADAAADTVADLKGDLHGVRRHLDAIDAAGGASNAPGTARLSFATAI